MDIIEIEKSKAFAVVEIIEYIPNAIVIKTILKKSSGYVSAMSFDSGESLTERVSAFDNFIQVIDGNAEIMIDDKEHSIGAGDSIILPAHTRNSIKARVRFKILSTVIKSGYE